MRCFYHGDVEAVALCKSCSRALCRECCSDTGKSAACRSRCEEDVLALDEMIERGRSAYQKTSGAYTRSGLFILVLGIAFSIIGILGFRGDGEPVMFLVVMGGLFLIYGVSQLFTALRFRAK